MPQPRLHADAAARQAAYRQRLKQTTRVVDRKAIENLEQKLEMLREVINQAGDAGDQFAAQCKGSSVDTTLDKLIAAFRSKGSSVREPHTGTAETRRQNKNFKNGV